MADFYPKVGVCYDHPESAKLYMIYTFACNAACDHCLVESSPKRKEKLGVEKAKEILRLSAQYGKSFLDLSGGEAMLFPEDVKEICRTARDLGYFVCLNTNAFWARTPEIARRTVQELKDAGLCALFPTASAYHSKYVPLERVANAREACRQVGLEYELNYFYSAEPGADEHIQKVLGLEGETVFFDGLQTTANNKDTLGKLKKLYPYKVPDDMDDSLSVHLAVNPHGHVVGTCNMNFTNAKFRDTPFFVGDFTETPFEELLKQERDNAVLQFIYRNPHPALHSMLVNDPEISAYHHETFAERRYYSVVDYYVDMFKDERVLRRIEQLLAVPTPA